MNNDISDIENQLTYDDIPIAGIIQDAIPAINHNNNADFIRTALLYNRIINISSLIIFILALIIIFILVFHLIHFS